MVIDRLVRLLLVGLRLCAVGFVHVLPLDLVIQGIFALFRTVASTLNRSYHNVGRCRSRRWNLLSLRRFLLFPGCFAQIEKPVFEPLYVERFFTFALFEGLEDLTRRLLAT